MPEPGPVSVTREPPMRVRTAQASDLDDLLNIETLAFASDRLSRRRLREMIRSATACVLVAESEGLVGYALVLMRSNSQAARLYSLAVIPGAEGRGAGSQLLKAAETAVQNRGAGSLRLEVRTDNAGAIRFYRGHGYLETGRHENYYADGMAAMRFARDLRAGESRPSSRTAYGASMSATADG